MDDGGSEVDYGLEAAVCLVTWHCYAFEFLQLAEEILDQVAPFVDVLVDIERLGAPLMLRDDDLRLSFVQVGLRLARRGHRRAASPRDSVPGFAFQPIGFAILGAIKALPGLFISEHRAVFDRCSEASETSHGHAGENISTNALIVPATFSSETCQAAPSSAA